LGKIGVKNEKATLDKRRTTLIVLEILKGAKTVNQAAKEHGVSDSLIYRWRDRALQGISEAFSNKKRNDQENSDAERERLLKIIQDMDASEAVKALEEAIGRRFEDTLDEGLSLSVRVDRGCQ